MSIDMPTQIFKPIGFNGLGKWANKNQLYYVNNNRENGNTRFLPNSAISFRDRHLLIDFMLLFRPIWQKGLYP